MKSHILTPLITSSELKSAYAAYTGQKPLAGHAILAFALVRQRLQSTDLSLNTLEIKALDVLRDFLTEYFAELRRINHRTDPRSDLPLEQAIADMQADDLTGNNDLICCSYLYYRYIRYDLGLSIQALQSCFAWSEGYMRRQVRHFWDTLRNAFIRREIDARNRLWRENAHLALPPPKGIQLKTHVAFIAHCQNLIRNTGILCLFGEPGLGKSRLAVQLAHLLIDEGDVQQAAYINLSNGPDEADAVVELIIERFNCPLQPHYSPIQQLQYHFLAMANGQQRTLIVLDHTDHLSEHVLATILGHTQQAFVLITQVHPLPERLGHSIECPRLTDIEVEHLLQYITWNRSMPLWEDHKQLLKHVDGNPGLLIKAANAIDLTTALQTHILRSWRAISKNAKRLWLLIDLLQGESEIIISETMHRIRQMFDMSLADYHDALEALVRYRLIDGNHFVIYPHIRQIIAQTSDYIKLIYTLSQEADITRYALLLLERNPRIQLSIDAFQQLFESARTEILQLGEWQRWWILLSRLRRDYLPMAMQLEIDFEMVIAQRWKGNLDAALAQVSVVVAQATYHGFDYLLVEALAEQSNIHFYRHEFEAARFVARRAIEHSELLDGAAALHDQCVMMLAQAEAELDLDHANRLIDTIVLRDAKTWDLSARIALKQNQLDRALSAAEACVELTRQQPAFARALGMYARVLTMVGDYERAVHQFDIAIALMQIRRDALGLPRLLTNQAVAYVRFAIQLDDEVEREGLLEQATDSLQRALSFYEQIEDRSGQQTALETLNLISQIRGNNGII